jgi:hypothetical protein
MSLFDAITKKAALKKAISQVAAARETSDENADALFNSAYKNFEAAIHKDLTISEALYNWGFALLHHARTKSGEEAVALYQDAVTKFSFCLTIDPDFLGAAIDGGVALMDLARLQQVSAEHNLYASAKRSFEKANKIQKGSASFNLACVHSLCHDEEACLAALQDAKQHGSLPEIDEIMGDPDLLNVANKAWFIDFVESLNAIEPQLTLEGKVEQVEATADTKTTEEQQSVKEQPSDTAEAKPDETSSAENAAETSSEQAASGFKSAENFEQ